MNGFREKPLRTDERTDERTNERTRAKFKFLSNSSTNQKLLANGKTSYLFSEKLSSLSQVLISLSSLLPAYFPSVFLASPLSVFSYIPLFFSSTLSPLFFVLPFLVLSSIFVVSRPFCTCVALGVS